MSARAASPATLTLDTVLTRSRTTRSILLCSAPALLLALACLLPFLNKPFTIDDPLFLQEAQHILVSPLHPMQTEICWNEDNWCGALSKTAPNNVLISYVWAPLVAASAPEWAFHACQILFLFAAILATVSLAFRFGMGAYEACAAGLILASTPPVLAMASTAMPDILAMSLGIIGAEQLVAWRQQGNAMSAICSAIALGLAIVARPHMLLICFCCLLLLRDDVRVGNLRSWTIAARRAWPLAGAIAVFAFALLLTREPGATGAPSAAWISSRFIVRNAQSYLLGWSLAMPLAGGWVLLRGNKMSRRVLVFFGAACVAAMLLHLVILQYTHAPAWKLVALSISGAVLLDLFRWAFKSEQVWTVFLAFCLLPPLAAIEYLHLPVKFLVPCAPAVALLLAGVARSSRWRTPAIAALITASVVWSCLVLTADAKLADMGRDAASKLVRPLVATGHRVWFVSQWGFQWYALRAGAKPLWTGQVPKPGDYLVRGYLEGYPETMARLPRAVLVATYSVGGPGGRTMSHKDNAGLYTNQFGLLMWAWGTGDWNHYQLWRFVGQ